MSKKLEISDYVLPDKFSQTLTLPKSVGAQLTRIGTVTIQPDGTIFIGDFEGKNCTSRDVAVLAMTEAIGVLQKELKATLMEPGGENAVVD